MATSKNVPRDACQFRADIEVRPDNIAEGEQEARSYPFEMTARSGKPIDHPYWGKVAHDLDGMQLSRSRVSIDVNHDAEKVIGFANKFDSSSGDLRVSGALVPYGDDAAKEILYRASQGVPYEASISFGGSGIEVETVPSGSSTEVNGYEFEGPGKIVRKWPLRSISIVQSGADQWTSTEFSEGEQVSIQENDDMSKDALAAAIGESLEKLDDTTASDEAKLAVDPQPANDTVEAADKGSKPEPAAVETELEARKSEGTKFIEAFGSKGALYFAQGLTWDQACVEFGKEMQAENEELRTKLAAAQTSGEAEPLSFSPENDKSANESWFPKIRQ